MAQSPVRNGPTNKSENAFDVSKAESAIQKYIEETIGGAEYLSINAKHKSAEMCKAIKNLMVDLAKNCGTEYKFMIHVSISELPELFKSSEAHIETRCSWIKETDRALRINYSNEFLQCIAVIFAISCQ
ncbi:hypothetical protein ACOME3_004353 [Neoechinorhynchus agilis]